LSNTKGPRKEKLPKKIVESFTLTPCPHPIPHSFPSTTYVKKQMTQIIPNVIWISMCVNYQAQYLNFMLLKGPLKDCKHDVLK
jgi:hypothetical protein